MAYPYEPQQLPSDFDLETLEVSPPDVDYSFHEKTTELVAVPAPLASVQVTVEDSTRYAIGMYLYFAGIGVLYVNGLPSATSISVESITATEGTSIPIGTPFASCAEPVETAEEADDPFVYDFLAEPFTIPAVGGSVAITVLTGGWFVLNGVIFVEGAGWFRITDPENGSDKSCIAEKLYENGSTATGVISAGSFVKAVTELPYAPDEDTIVTDFSGGSTPGYGVMIVGPQFPQAPDSDDTIIQVGFTPQTASLNGHSSVGPISFGEEFEDLPVVVITPFFPNGSNSSTRWDVTDLSTTEFSFHVDATTTGADSQFMWIAVGQRKQS